MSEYKNSMKEYQLYQGDCIQQMQQLIEEDVKVDLILTDPPYGTTACKWDTIIPLEEMWNCVNGLSQKSTPILLFSDEPFSSTLRLSNIKNYKYDWIWIKEGPSNIGNAKIRPMKYTENINVFYTKQCKFYSERIMIPRISRRVEQGQKTGCVGKVKMKKNISVANGFKSGYFITDYSTYDADQKNPSNCLYFSRVKANSNEKVDHPAQKPVKLLEHLIKTYTDEGDTILDFTMGSGSTGVACMNLNRKFIGIELEEKYYNIAEQRLKEATQSKQTTLI